MASRREMHLLGFMLNNPMSHMILSWADELDGRRTGFSEPAYWVHIAQTLERGRFDGVFFADAPFAFDTYQSSIDTTVRYAIGFPTHDPLPLVAIMGASTTDLGFAVTLSTQHPPYLAVRTLGTLDHLTSGRVGWNIVTDFHKNLAQNLGMTDLLPHDERYRRADEYMNVCDELWRSWDADAVVVDTEQLVYADPSKVRKIHHHGEFFDCLGPSAVEPSPQGRPVLFQAGSSPRGREFAARHAEVAFSIQRTAEGMASYTNDMRNRVALLGRDPDAFRLIFGVFPIIGDTAAIARERHEELLARVPVEASLARLSGAFGIDFSTWDVDLPLEHQKIDGVQGLLDMFTTMMPGQQITLREAATAFGFSLGMPTLVGTAEDIADQLEALFVEGGGDGFNISVPATPYDYERFVDEVVPHLRKRGLTRTEYQGATFRDRLTS